MAAISLQELETRLGKALGKDLQTYLEEPALGEIQKAVENGLQILLSEGPAFGMFHNADFSLARLCYAVARARRPSIIVETGVAYGVTSAFLLQALQVNGLGGLRSIDLPPLADDAARYSGCLVPAHLKPRWHTLRGASRRVLPQLVAQLSSLDMFVHDSLHTFNNMNREFQTVWPKLRPGGLLLSDDVDINRAFQGFAAQPSVAFSAVAREQDKDSHFGVIIKGK